MSIMIKTKIVCTIGPASNSYEKIEKLIQEGMDVARLNFSHGSYEEHLPFLLSQPVPGIPQLENLFLVGEFALLNLVNWKIPMI
jgi:hypothetical protein